MPAISRPEPDSRSASATGISPAIRPPYRTTIRSASARISSRSEQISRTPLPGRATARSCAPHELGGGDVDPAGGLRGDVTGAGPASSRARTTRWALPPDSVRAGSSRSAAGIAEAPDESRSHAVAALPSSTPRRAIGGLAGVPPDDEVVADASRRPRGRAGSGPPGCSASPHARRSRNAGGGDVAPVDGDPAGGRRHEPGDDVRELGLAVAGHAGDADDLAGPDVEVDRPEPGAGSRSSSQERTPGLDRRPLEVDDRTSRPTIARASSAVDVSRPRATAVTRPSRRTVTRSARSMTSSSWWLTNTVALPAVAELVDDAEQAVGLLRGQDRGRLVEDEDAGLAVERPQDLDPLQRADRELADSRVRGRR